MCKNIICKYCNSNRINHMGVLYGKQRYYCRDCKRTFREGKDNRVKYSEEKREKVIKMYLDNVSIRSIERLEGVSEPLIIKWIKNKGKKIKEELNNNINKLKNNIDNIDDINIIKKDNIEILEIDEIVTYVKKNSKILKQEKEIIPGYGLLLIGTKIILLDLK